MNSEDSFAALLVGDYKEDRLLVHEIFRKRAWRLFEACGRRHAMECLDRNPVHVLIIESNLCNWEWKRVVRDLRRRVQPPQLIVTSRHADESLWLEVLNFGGYDVMSQPLDSHELERVVASAHRHLDYRPLTASA